jgi:6-phosphofructokinase 1
MLVEVMGRNAGWLALESGIAGGGDIILLPEIPYDIEEVVRVIERRNRKGNRFSIIVVAEGAKPIGGEQTIHRIVADSPDPIRLGGISQILARQIEDRTGNESRATILGHVQRGGTPSPLDRLLGTQFASKAIDMLSEGQFNQMAALQGSEMVAVPLEKVMGKQRLVPPDSPLIKAALSLGTSFGVEII